VQTDASALSVAFSPDGRTLAVGTFADLTQLWNVDNPAAPVSLGQPLISQQGPITSVSFAPDGRTLATGSFDGTVQLWDVANPASATEYGHPILANQQEVNRMAYSPGGSSLATADADGNLELLPLAPPQALNWVCQTIPGVLTQQAWLKYVAGLSYAPPCGTGH
jgi:WD40 repeat protein